MFALVNVLDCKKNKKREERFQIRKLAKKQIFTFNVYLFCLNTAESAVDLQRLNSKLYFSALR